MGVFNILITIFLILVAIGFVGWLVCMLIYSRNTMAKLDNRKALDIVGTIFGLTCIASNACLFLTLIIFNFISK